MTDEERLKALEERLKQIDIILHEIELTNNKSRRQEWRNLMTVKLWIIRERDQLKRDIN